MGWHQHEDEEYNIKKLKIYNKLFIINNLKVFTKQKQVKNNIENY